MGLRRIHGRVFSLLAIAVFGLPGSSAIAEEPGPLTSFDAVIVATAHDADAQSSEVRRVHVGPSGQRSTAIGVVGHAPGAVVRGDARDGVAWIVADEDPGLPDWGAALFEVRGGQGARRVLGRVGRAGRPLASGSGWVFVERGRAGTPPTIDEAKQGRLRVDAITVDAYDPRTTATRTIYSSDAYALHLAGEHGGELVVYRVAPDGAALLAIDEASGRSRVVTALMPFARDFSIDERRGALVLSNRDGADAHTWTLERIDLTTGARTVLHATRDDQPAALALPSGELAFTADGRRGLVAAGHSMAPLGAGFDAPVLATDDGALFALEHREPGGWDRTAVVDVATGRAVRLGGDERVTILELGSATGGVR